MTPKTVADAVTHFRTMPAGTLVPATSVAEMLTALVDAGLTPEPAPVDVPVAPTWRERLWLVPAETRLDVAGLCEAVGRSRSWAYKLTASKSIPCRRLDGELVFLAGEVRAWLRSHEEPVAGGDSEPAPWERAGLRLTG